jgi:hypothetical protein
MKLKSLTFCYEEVTLTSHIFLLTISAVLREPRHFHAVPALAPGKKLNEAPATKPSEHPKSSGF